MKRVVAIPPTPEWVINSRLNPEFISPAATPLADAMEDTRLGYLLRDRVTEPAASEDPLGGVRPKRRYPPSIGHPLMSAWRLAGDGWRILS